MAVNLFVSLTWQCLWPLFIHGNLKPSTAMSSLRSGSFWETRPCLSEAAVSGLCSPSLQRALTKWWAPAWRSTPPTSLSMWQETSGTSWTLWRLDVLQETDGGVWSEWDSWRQRWMWWWHSFYSVCLKKRIYPIEFTVTDLLSIFWCRFKTNKKTLKKIKYF